MLEGIPIKTNGLTRPVFALLMLLLFGIIYVRKRSDEIGAL